MSDEWKLDMLKEFWSGNDIDLEKQLSESKSMPKTKKAKASFFSIDLHDFSSLERQLEIVEASIDIALNKKAPGIIIIHGKGEGILKRAIIKTLQNYTQIVSFKPVKDAKGESGALKVKFK